MQSCTTGAIALWPTGNHQGGYYFMSLSIGHCLTRNQWTALPMPQDVIDHVNTLGHCSHAAEALTFTCRDGTPVADDDDDDSNDDSNFLLADDSSTDASSAAGVDEADDDGDFDENDNNDDNMEIDGAEADEDPANAQPEADEDPADANGDEPEADEDPANANGDADEDPADNDDHEVPPLTDQDDEDVEDDDDDDVDTIDEHVETTGVDSRTDDHGKIPGVHNDILGQMDALYGARNHKYDLCPRKPRDYSHLHAQLEHTAFTQYNIKKGLKMFGQTGADAVVKEMQQLHDRSVILPHMAHMLARDEKRASLQYLMFLKKK